MRGDTCTDFCRALIFQRKESVSMEIEGREGERSVESGARDIERVAEN